VFVWPPTFPIRAAFGQPVRDGVVPRRRGGEVSLGTYVRCPDPPFRSLFQPGGDFGLPFKVLAEFCVYCPHYSSFGFFSFFRYPSGCLFSPPWPLIVWYVCSASVAFCCLGSHTTWGFDFIHRLTGVFFNFSSLRERDTFLLNRLWSNNRAVRASERQAAFVVFKMVSHRRL